MYRNISMIIKLLATQYEFKQSDMNITLCETGGVLVISVFYKSKMIGKIIYDKNEFMIYIESSDICDIALLPWYNENQTKLSHEEVYKFIKFCLISIIEDIILPIKKRENFYRNKKRLI